MKLITFEIASPLVGRQPHLGVLLTLSDSRQVVVALNRAYAAWRFQETGATRTQAQRWADFFFPSDMTLFLTMGKPAWQAAHEVAETWSRFSADEALGWLGLNEARCGFALSEIRLHPPVPQPRMLRDFIAFEAHVANGWKLWNEPIPEAWYKFPMYYKGNPHTLIGPEDEVVWPEYTRRLDYELELACVIGKEGINIAVEEATSHIAGYLILNDFSARDIQRHEMQCRLGPAKAKDFATAIGPWLVTPDEVGNARNLTMQARVNGEIWSTGHSGDAHWRFEDMIAHASMGETLYPGDILGAGTVGFGSGFELNRWLQPGDVVELEIEGLGVLRNKIAMPIQPLNPPKKQGQH